MILPAAQRLEHIQEYYFSQKLEEIRLMNLQGRDVINLGIGSPDLPPSPETLQASQEALQNPKSHGYASYKGTPELRKAIADWYLKTYQVTADPDREVLPLLGSKEGLFYISMAFLNPGDKVLVPNPGYPAYSSVTRLAGAEILPYDLLETNQWQPDFEALSKLDLKSVKLMWVNYPQMPTGQPANADLFRKLIEFGEKHQILICHDNPYGLVLNTDKPLSLLKYDPDMQHSLELNSFSKAFNMAGWRVGMVLGHPDVIETILKVKSNVDSGMFLAVQAGAIQALKNSEQWHEERNSVYRERREEVYQIFDHLGCAYSRNQEGLFLWAQAPKKIANVKNWVDEILKDRAVFLTPGFIFGSNGERYLRCSLCAPLERIQEAKTKLGGLK